MFPLGLSSLTVAQLFYSHMCFAAKTTLLIWCTIDIWVSAFIKPWIIKLKSPLKLWLLFN